MISKYPSRDLEIFVKKYIFLAITWEILLQ